MALQVTVQEHLGVKLEKIYEKLIFYVKLLLSRNAAFYQAAVCVVRDVGFVIGRCD